MQQSEAAANWRGQRFGRRIAMERSDRDSFLNEQRTARLATVDGNQRPHVTPVWFWWDGKAAWMLSLVRSSRWNHLTAHAFCAIVVDDGDEYAELRGVEFRGSVEVVGEVPRRGDPVEELVPVEAGYAAKYRRHAELEHDGRHAWLRFSPEFEYSWDFRKLDA